MSKPPKSPVFASVVCYHCGTQHIDRNTETFPFAEKNHSMHLCLKADGGCGRRFFTKSNIGVAPDDPRCMGPVCKCSDSGDGQGSLLVDEDCPIHGTRAVRSK